ncbi:MYXO-CTERM sorting domain-containing protein [Enhygromyxa salina]|nr:MYXO-CTERM sorting domain-containing protein [Enhygromyxa salina]
MRELAFALVFVFAAGSSSLALADVEPEPPPTDEGDSDCSVVGDGDALLGLAVFVLLVSGVSLRRRSCSSALAVDRGRQRSARGGRF